MSFILFRTILWVDLYLQKRNLKLKRDEVICKLPKKCTSTDLSASGAVRRQIPLQSHFIPSSWWTFVRSHGCFLQEARVCQWVQPLLSFYSVWTTILGTQQEGELYILKKKKVVLLLRNIKSTQREIAKEHKIWMNTFMGNACLLESLAHEKWYS